MTFFWLLNAIVGQKMASYHRYFIDCIHRFQLHDWLGSAQQTSIPRGTLPFIRMSFPIEMSKSHLLDSTA